MPKLKKYSTKYRGVRFYEHHSRIYKKKLDRYFSIRLRVDGVLIEEGLGWASEGMTQEKANELLTELKKSRRTGKGPKTLKEKRDLQKLSEIEKMENDLFLKKRNIKFKEAWETYLKDSKRKASWEREESLYKFWISPAIGDLQMNEILPLHIENIQTHIISKGRSERTAQYAFSVIRQVFNFARKNDLIDFPSPTNSLKPRKKDNHRVRFLEKNEADLLLNSLREKSKRVYTMALLGLHCGLRRSEILNIKYSDIDLDNGIIFIKDTKSKRNRHVFITETLKTALPDNISDKNKWLFPHGNEGRLKDIPRIYYDTVNELGLNENILDSRQKVVFHTLRHTFASWLVKKGFDLYRVQKLLGHSSILMTQRYSHLSPETLRCSAEIIETF